MNIALESNGNDPETISRYLSMTDVERQASPQSIRRLGDKLEGAWPSLDELIASLR